MNASNEPQANLRVPSRFAFIESFICVLKDSEGLLIQFMGWDQARAIVSKAVLKGNVEYGIFLFLLKNTSFIEDWYVRWLIRLVKFIIFFIRWRPLPESRISDEQYEKLKQSRRVDDSGALIATSAYAAFDQKWLAALINMVKTIWHKGQYATRLPLPANSLKIPLEISDNNNLVIGMLGDWGAGSPASEDVMNSLLKVKQLDYLIHLGDVYYSGTPSSNPKKIKYQHPGEERDNLIAKWPGQFSGKSFTLNSNHEMYCGAMGLFQDALLPGNSPFHAQGQTTVFALAAGDWTILGLDSAFNSDPHALYMYGNLDVAGTFDQVKWIMGLDLDPAKTIVLTHHNGFDAACSGENQHYYTYFWEQVRYALGGDPYAWYWGHIHNNIVYKTPVSIFPVDENGQQLPRPVFKTNTYCRCVGNGSMPYGVSSAIVKNPAIDWYVGKGNCSISDELPNGFMTLHFEFGLNGKCARIEEKYYTANGTKPDYRNSLFLAQ